MCKTCAKRQTCQEPCAAYLTGQMIIRLQSLSRNMAVELKPPAKPTLRRSSKRPGRFVKVINAIAIAAAVVAADSIADPSVADHVIGDPPHTIITLVAYRCGSDRSAHYVDKPNDTTCGRVDLHKPVRP